MVGAGKRVVVGQLGISLRGKVIGIFYSAPMVSAMAPMNLVARRRMRFMNRSIYVVGRENRSAEARRQMAFSQASLCET